ncbi:MAG TPA: 3-ketoacyl-ACP reductase [Verrucomicrobiales bacterium]|nr:3-ketoacyl-ACP reductase [Verrucomicrobiales bacterium]
MASSTLPHSPPLALVTGGTRGIGLAIARRLAADGYRLAINGVREKAHVADLLLELSREGVPAVYCQGDIGRSAARQSILKEIRSGLGPVSLLINNAGVAPERRGDLLEMEEDSFDRVLAVNLKGAFFLTQQIARDMIAATQNDPAFRACVINVSSVSATMVSIARGEYCISKAGLSMATLLFAARLAPHGIPVYEIRPGLTRTDMTAGVKERYDLLLEEGLCLQARWGEPDDCAKAVSALARGDFPYSTGQAICIDGGLTVPRL